MSIEQNLEKLLADADRRIHEGEDCLVHVGEKPFKCAGAKASGPATVVGETHTFITAVTDLSGEPTNVDTCHVAKCMHFDPLLFRNRCNHPNGNADTCTVYEATTGNRIARIKDKWIGKGVPIHSQS